ncbi:CBS domain-containing protein [Pseudonocardia xishanensis]|uniref:CBS domain-containing protein n=1 Tax=Pseudonocardia xishanensis TaxID=630995 RepID=A0ABP8RT86_9PSEU
MTGPSGSGPTAADVMTSPVLTVRVGTTVRAAAAMLAAHGFTAAPVLDGAGRLVGVVTEADLLRGTAVVDDVMGTPPLVRAPADPLADVVTLMLEAHVRSIPIVEADRLVGIVTRRDALRMLAWGEHTADEVRRRRGLPPPAPGGRTGRSTEPAVAGPGEQERRRWTER